MKKKPKKVFIIAGGIFVGLMIALVIFMISIGLIVKVAINSVLPEITGTPCSIGMCTFNPVLGKVTIRNLNIGNPEGYAKENAFELGTLVIDVGLGSLLSNKIQIEEITIDSMNVDYEIKLTETNISVIKNNINKYSGSDTPEVVKEEPKEDEDVESTTDIEDSEDEKKLQIDLFQFKNSSVIMGTGGGNVRLPLGEIILKNLGTDSPYGITAGELSQKVFPALYESILTAVKAQATSIDTDSIKKGATNVLKDVKNFFGGKKK